MDELYRQEVLELTELLREDEDWKDLRDILIKKGFVLNEIVLAAFMEDDEENEYGVIVTPNMKVSEYSRSTKEGENNIEHFSIKDISSKKNEIDKYPQIYVAIDMINNREI